MVAEIGPQFDRPEVSVVDKRRVGAEPAEDPSLQDDATSAKKDLSRLNENLNAVSPVDPIEVLLAKTFQFILAQPEWLAVLNASREDRKRFEKHVAKMISRFPHMSKQRM